MREKTAVIAMIVIAHIITSMNISTICSRKSARGVPGPRSLFSCCNITCRRVASRRLVTTPWDVNFPVAARKERKVEGRASREPTVFCRSPERSRGGSRKVQAGRGRPALHQHDISEQILQRELHQPRRASHRRDRCGATRCPDHRRHRVIERRMIE